MLLLTEVQESRYEHVRKFSSEEKIRIVLDGLRGEVSIAELCRREGINNNLYYRWSKDFLEAGKKRLAGDTVREANTDEVVDLKKENKELKQAVAELYLRNDWLKKSDWAGCDLGRRLMYSASEKLAIIRLVEESELSIRRTLSEVKVSRSSFYRWYQAYERHGFEGLKNRSRASHQHWNKIPDSVRQQVVDVALEQPELTPRELAWHITDNHNTFVSESSVYRILKAHDLITSPQFMVMSASDAFQSPTRRVHELWQTDFTYFRVVGWGWYFLSTVLDDYSRYIISWRLTTSMAARDVTDTLEDALKAADLKKARVCHKPRLLSDNGPCYISSELREWLKQQQIKHTRGAPYHPMTQGKIERYHRSMKNVVKLENYYFPWELEKAIGDWVQHYNHERYHESLDNVTPADVYYGRRNDILDQRAIIKSRTMTQRKVHNLR
ncbi:IS3 family transposase, partial [Solemya velum gill symbiont]|uniref:IS3 family transposase n=1 Tax=Solemya velum gill symbiont TaxID=2340 RepID=UPI00351D7FB3